MEASGREFIGCVVIVRPCEQFSTVPQPFPCMLAEADVSIAKLSERVGVVSDPAFRADPPSDTAVWMEENHVPTSVVVQVQRPSPFGIACNGAFEFSIRFKIAIPEHAASLGDLEKVSAAVCKVFPQARKSAEEINEQTVAKTVFLQRRLDRSG